MSKQLRKDAAEAARRLIGDRVKAIETLADTIDAENAAAQAHADAREAVETARRAAADAGWKRADLDEMGLARKREGSANRSGSDRAATAPNGAVAAREQGEEDG